MSYHGRDSPGTWTLSETQVARPTNELQPPRCRAPQWQQVQDANRAPSPFYCIGISTQLEIGFHYCALSRSWSVSRSVETFSSVRTRPDPGATIPHPATTFRSNSVGTFDHRLDFNAKTPSSLFSLQNPFYDLFISAQRTVKPESSLLLMLHKAWVVRLMFFSCEH
ncbi:hypothetical protein HRR84_005245 [Exophiala dermatitidis]|nr:hypothetical protein HRR84_005245 [Exophiala dermatitidis]